MNFSADLRLFTQLLDEFKPDSNHKSRWLAIFSASLALADESLIVKALTKGKKADIKRDEFYEIILQSYLFLGFPRMLVAANCLHKVFPNDRPAEQANRFEYEEFNQRGVELCRDVYKDKYEPLKKKVMTIAPEIFQWMILEGYGKVLSRDTVDIISRELAIVSSLMMENRSQQLESHIRGAINVGASKDLVKTVIEDIGQSAGDGYKSACLILENL